MFFNCHSCALQGTRVAHRELRQVMRTSTSQRGKSVEHGKTIRSEGLEDTDVPQQLFHAGGTPELSTKKSVSDSKVRLYKMKKKKTGTIFSLWYHRTQYNIFVVETLKFTVTTNLFQTYCPRYSF